MMQSSTSTRWLFDLGNTRLKAAPLLTNGQLGPVIALGHHKSDLLSDLRAALPTQGLSACLASVASPELTLRVTSVLQEHFRVVSLARTQAHWGLLRIAYPQPERLGVDRFLAMLGALQHGTGPWLVAGIGTALTLDLIDAHGLHLGGRIAPSPQLMRQALHRAAAQLPAEGGEFNEFANTTTDALASGCDGAALALIERSLTQATHRLNQTPHLLLHGGGAAALMPHLSQAQHIESLVLEGLAAWAGTPQAQSTPSS